MDVSQINIEADAYVRSVAEGYRQLPNPQPFSEAMPLGLSSTLSNLAQSGSPLYSPVLSAAPSIQAPQLVIPQQRLPVAGQSLPISGLTAPAAPDPTAFDPHEYLKQNLSQEKDFAWIRYGGEP